MNTNDEPIVARLADKNCRHAVLREQVTHRPSPQGDGDPGLEDESGDCEESLGE